VTGIVLLTYGDIGGSLLEAAAHVLGEDVVDAAAIAVRDTPTTIDELPGQIDAVLNDLGCAQYLLLVDLPGSTHFNVARGFTRRGNIALLTGLNLPMLLRVLTHRECGLDELLHFGSDGGIQGILSFYPASEADDRTGT